MSCLFGTDGSVLLGSCLQAKCTQSVSISSSDTVCLKQTPSRVCAGGAALKMFLSISEGLPTAGREVFFRRGWFVLPCECKCSWDLKLLQNLVSLSFSLLL